MSSWRVRSGSRRPFQNADRILVLRDGVIEEQGGFAELVARGGFFSQLYNLQAAGTEARGARR